MKEEKNQPTVPQGWDAAQQNTEPKNVQYVVMQKSVQGVGGWLTFWVVMFALGALGYISTFFTSLLTAIQAGSLSGSTVLTLIFSLPIAVLYIVTLVFILQQKKVGRSFAWVSLGVVAVYLVAERIVEAASTTDTALAVIAAISGIMAIIVGLGLVALYFLLSKRVKATLIK